MTSNSMLTDHFSLKEYCYGIYRNEIKAKGEDNTLYADSVKHALLLEEFRVWLSEPMKVNAWQRPPKFNQSVGGTANSGHLYGTATDIACKIREPEFKRWYKQWQKICKAHKTVACMGLYSWGVHFESYPKWTKKDTYWKEVNGKLIYNF